MKRTVINNIVHRNGETETLIYKHQDYSLFDIVKFRKMFGATVEAVSKGVAIATFEMCGDKHQFIFIAEE